MLRSFAFWVRALFSRSALEDDLSREMQTHIDLATEDLIARGIEPVEARRQAMVAFGGVERHKESVRDVRGTQVFESTREDIRYAWRGLRRRPLFAVATMLTLGLGLGTVITVFSWANWILLRPIPGVRSPGELVSVRFAESRFNETGISWPNLRDLRQGSQSFTHLSGYAILRLQIGGDGAAADNASGIVVDDKYFTTLGVSAARGRLFSPDELDPSTTPNVAMISDRLWHNSFGSALDITSRKLRLNAVEFRIIGVLPPNFRGLDRTGEGDVWMPLSAYPVLSHSESMNPARRNRNLMMNVVGRLRSGVTTATAQLELRRTMTELIRLWPGDEGGTEVYTEYLPTVYEGAGADRFIKPVLTDASLILGGVAALVLLIAVANAANLLLLRSSRRRAEYAVRHAVGASTGRLMRQHLAEGILLSGFSAVVGIAVAGVMAKLFRAGGWGVAGMEQLQFDRRVLLTAIGITGLVGLLIGVAPVLVSHSRSLMRHLKDEARSAPSSSRLRSSLTVAQLALSLALVICALMLSLSLRSLHQVSPGFNPDNLTLFGVNSTAQGYTTPRTVDLRETLLRRTQETPGIVAAAVTSSLPFGSGSFTTKIRTPQDSGKQWRGSTTVFGISPDFFRAAGIEMLSGRTFTAEEYAAGVPNLVVISERVAKSLFGSANVVGRDLTQRASKGPLTQTIIGVVNDIRGSENSLRTEGEMSLYQTTSPLSSKAFYLLVRGPAPAGQIEGIVRGHLGALDPALPFFINSSMIAHIDESMTTINLFARLVGVLALLAIGLAAVGLYSVIAFGVSERTREIGIRMALGADGRGVIALVVRRSARLVGLGILFGVPLAFALSKVLEAQLFGISRLDPMIYFGGAGIIVLLSLAASVLPIRSAVRVMPAVTLRSE